MIRFLRSKMLYIRLLCLILVLAILLGTSDVMATTFPNGGFETGAAGVPDSWDWPGEDWAWDSQVVHSGSHSARVSRSSGPETTQLWSSPITLQPSTIYTLSYWLRTSNATYSPAVEVFQFTSADVQIGPRLRSWVNVGDGTNNWFPVTFRFQTTPNVDHIRVRVFLWTDTAGTFWFDDFSLDEGPQAPYPFQNGFPIVAPDWIRFSSPAVADLDNDGDNELLIGAGGSVGGWNSAGAVLPGFPLATGDERIIGQIALADLDSDDDLEIVAGTKAPYYGGRGRVFVWHHNGSAVSGWPRSVDWLGQYGTEFSEVYSVALADIDGDKDLEVLAGTTNGAPGYSGSNPPASPNLYAWHADGTMVTGLWPTWHLTAAIYGAIAASDLNGDEIADVITGRDSNYLFAYAADGSYLPGWPITTYLYANDGEWQTDLRIEHHNSAPVIADLDLDGTAEYIVVGNVMGPGNDVTILNSALLVLEPDGTRRAGWEMPALGSGLFGDEFLPQLAPAIADLNKDGKLEIVVTTYDGWIRAYKADGTLLWAFDYAQGDALFASEPVIGDINADNNLEVIFGSYDPALGHGSVGLWGLSSDGAPLPGFPLPVGTPGIRAAPTLADLDNDGDLEILAASWTGPIFVWDTPSPYNPMSLPWPTGRQNQRRTAAFEHKEPNFDASTKFASDPTPQYAEVFTYTIRLVNSGLPLTTTLVAEDVIPAALAYVPGTLQASLGEVAISDNTVQWSGVPSDTAVITIRYATRVEVEVPQMISNTVTIENPTIGTIRRTAIIVANGLATYLPVITKAW